MNNKIICGFHEHELFVNPPGSLMATKLGSLLNFSVLNPKSNDSACFRHALDENSKSIIQIIVDFGEGDYNMFAPKDTGYGTIVGPEGFHAGSLQKHPTLNGKLYCNITADSDLSLAGGEAIHFKWMDIISTSCEGFFSVTVKFINIGGMENQTILCQLYKKRLEPRILQFEASPSSVGGMQPIILHWRVSNAEKGYILPGNFDIFEKGIQQSSSREVLLKEDSDGFYLNLSGENFSTFQRVNVFTVLPVISAFKIDEKNISWEVCFVKDVELRIDDGPPCLLKAIDQYTLLKTAQKISLRCTNSVACIQYERFLPSIPEIDFFIRETTIFPGHKIVKVSWKTAGLASISLKVWDTEFFEFLNENSGSRELAYELKTNVFCELHYKTATGKADSLPHYPNRCNG